MNGPIFVVVFRDWLAVALYLLNLLGLLVVAWRWRRDRMHWKTRLDLLEDMAKSSIDRALTAADEAQTVVERLEREQGEKP